MNASWRSTTPASTRASTILRHWCPFQPMPQSSIHWLQSMLLGNYHAANGRAQGVVPASFACPRRGRMFNTGCGFTSVHHRKGPILPSTSPSPAATPAAINQKVSIPMVCIPVHWNGRRHGMDWYPMHWSPLHTNATHSRPRRRPDTRPGKGIKNLEDLSLQFG